MCVVTRVSISSRARLIIRFRVRRHRIRTVRIHSRRTILNIPIRLVAGCVIVQLVVFVFAMTDL